MYTPAETRKMLDIAPQTLANWAKRFEDHLSPQANPPQGSHRRFSQDDLVVLQTVSELYAAGLNTESVLTTLSSGQRILIEGGESGEDRLSLAIRARISDLEHQVDDMRIQEAMLRGENRLLREMLEAAQKEIISLQVAAANRLQSGSESQ